MFNYRHYYLQDRYQAPDIYPKIVHGMIDCTLDTFDVEISLLAWSNENVWNVHIWAQKMTLTSYVCFQNKLGICLYHFHFDIYETISMIFANKYHKYHSENNFPCHPHDRHHICHNETDFYQHRQIIYTLSMCIIQIGFHNWCNVLMALVFYYTVDIQFFQCWCDQVHDFLQYHDKTCKVKYYYNKELKRNIFLCNVYIQLDSCSSLLVKYYFTT